MSERHLIVVDTETTGLDINKHVVLEIAAINTVTGEELHFAPYFNMDALADANPMALAINRYFERKVFEDRLGINATREKAEQLYDMLEGNTLAGSNPAFDAAMLQKFFGDVFEDSTAPWHYRLADIAAYAAGVLGRSPSELPGLHDVLTELDIINDEPHSALGDARATAAAFAALHAVQFRAAPPTISMPA